MPSIVLTTPGTSLHDLKGPSPRHVTLPNGSVVVVQDPSKSGIAGKYTST